MGIQKRKVSEQVVDRIIDQIREGELAPGQRLLNERALAEELGVSRMPLREALHALQQVGILEIRHGEGTFVSHYDPDKTGRLLYWHTLLSARPVYDLLATRRLIEGEAARLAALHATDRDIETIREAMIARERAVERGTDWTIEKEVTARLNSDREFHLAIARASHNVMFPQFIAAISSTLRIHQETAARTGVVAQDVTRIHREIVNAIVEKRSEDARELMHEHLDLVGQAIEGFDAQLDGGKE